ncbi:MAG: tetratricopeptide repeat protein [Roseivirga sp.]
MPGGKIFSNFSKLKASNVASSGLFSLRTVIMELIKLPNLRYQRLILAICTVIAFGGSLSNGYALDDENVTTPDNVRVSQGLHGIGAILTEVYDKGGFDGNDSYGYRPLPMITFAIEKAIFGFSQQLSHLINLLLYLGLLRVLFSCLSSLLAAYPPWIPFVTVLLFALHPLHTEVVASLKNREELLVSLFGFSALLHFIRYTEKPKKLRLLCGFLMMGLGVLCKATLAPFMLAIPILLWSFDKLSLKKAMILGFSLTAFTALVYFLPVRLMSIDLGRETYFFENPLAFMPAIDRLPTAVYSFLIYLKLHLFPYPLLSYYGYDQVPVLNWRSVELYPGLVLILGLALAFYFSVKRNKLFAVGLMLLVLFVAPYLNFPIAVPGMIAERFTFNSVLGFALMLTALMYQPPFKYSKRQVSPRLRNRLVALLVIIGVIFTGMDIKRNGEWKDFYTLMKADVQRAPDSFKLNMMYGDVTQVRINGVADPRERIKLIEEAIAAYKQAIMIYPDHADVYNNLGVVHTLKQDFGKAIPYLLKAMEKGQDKADTYYNLGVCYEVTQNTVSARLYYQKALNKDPAYTPARERLQAIGPASGN